VSCLFAVTALSLWALASIDGFEMGFKQIDITLSIECLPIMIFSVVIYIRILCSEVFFLSSSKLNVVEVKEVSSLRNIIQGIK
jgi:hypothetical protein